MVGCSAPEDENTSRAGEKNSMLILGCCAPEQDIVARMVETPIKMMDGIMRENMGAYRGSKEGTEAAAKQWGLVR